AADRLSVARAGCAQAGGSFPLSPQPAGAAAALSLSLTTAGTCVGIGGSVTAGSVTDGTIGIGGHGNVDVAVATIGGVKHVAVHGSGLSGSIATGGSALTLSVTGGSFTANPDGVNWSTSTVKDIVPASIKALDGTVIVAAAGPLSVDVAGFAQAGGSFTLTSQTAGADSALSLTLSSASIFVGIGGSVTGGVVTDGTIGVSGSGSVDVAIATIS